MTTTKAFNQKQAALQRYAAKLLFQYRFQNESSNPVRTVEERIIVIHAVDAACAFDEAKIKGKEATYSFYNSDKKKCFFEFVGCLELIHLGMEVNDDEVWYSIKRMRNPTARKRDLIPSRGNLSAFKYEKLCAEDR